MFYSVLLVNMLCLPSKWVNEFEHSRRTCSKAGSRSSSSWHSLRPFPPGYKPGSSGTLLPPRISGGPPGLPRPLYGGQDTPHPRCPRTPEQRMDMQINLKSMSFHLYTMWKCHLPIEQVKIYFLSSCHMHSLENVGKGTCPKNVIVERLFWVT